jgi:hypothetical protein
VAGVVTVSTSPIVERIPVARERYEFEIQHWRFEVANQHIARYGGRPIQQRTVLDLRGTVTGGTSAEAVGQAGRILLTFEASALSYHPSASIEAGGVRIDAFLMHGQEAAAIAILQSGTRIEAFFDNNFANGSEQPVFVMECQVR